jgi:hypothetical protein
MTPAPPPHSPQGRALAGALALCLSFEPAFARAAPAPRDLAYERGVQAEEAGDHAAAADGFAEAYRLTPPTEVGPRLLFLRASVAARLRAHAGASGTTEHLCAARALLRDYLGETAPTRSPDPLAEERESLASVDRQLGDGDCAPVPAPTNPVLEDMSRKDPAAAPIADGPVPEDRSQAAPAGDRPVREDSSQAASGPPAGAGERPDRRRALVIAGATSLAAGAAALVVMGVGVGVARDATRDGRAVCWSMTNGCHGSVDGLPEILGRGRLGDQLVKAGATIGGLATLAGVVLFALAARTRPRARLGVAPRLAPGTAAIGLWGRF